MRKFEFYLGTGFSGCDHEEVIELPDDYTDDEIDKEYEEWVDNQLDKSWIELTENEMEGEE